MPDYQKGKIYTIRNRLDTTLIYVGSTTQSLSSRFSGHKRDLKSSFSKLVDGDWSNWYIELYEEYKCVNKEQLEKREGEIIREIGTINKRIAGRTKKEYYTENLENILIYQKNYRENNKEKALQYIKEYYKKNKGEILQKSGEQVVCECGKTCTKGHLLRHKKSKTHQDWCQLPNDKNLL